jgi:hypothetical protein
MYRDYFGMGRDQVEEIPSSSSHVSLHHVDFPLNDVHVLGLSHGSHLFLSNFG